MLLVACFKKVGDDVRSLNSKSEINQSLVTSTPTFPAQKFLACRSDFSDIVHASMKAKIIITPKKAVVDPQGKTVQGALEQMGYKGVIGVHVGKYIEIDLAPGTDKTAAQRALNDAAHKFLSNPIIEDYKLEIE
jgi:phosphoribosylformylglycinamidine synthase PurS subunit